MSTWLSHARGEFLATLVVLWVNMMVGPQGLAATDRNSPNCGEILLLARESTEVFPPIPFSMHVETTAGGPSYGGERRFVEEQRWDGRRYDCASRNYGRSNATEVWRSGNDYRIVWDGTTWITRAPGNHHGELAVAAGLKQARVEDAMKARQSGGFLMGRLYGEEDILSILATAGKAAKLRPDTERVNSADCRVMTAKTAYGNITVWLDPQKRYLVQRAVVEKTVGDILLGEAIAPDRESHSIRARVELSDVEVGRVGKYDFPIAGKMTYICTEGGKEVIRETYITRRSEINSHPSFASINAFHMDGIPEGHLVNFVDAPGIRYVWHEGKAIIASDPAIAALIDAAVSKEPRWMGRGPAWWASTWVWTGGLAFGCILALVIWCAFHLRRSR